MREDPNTCGLYFSDDTLPQCCDLDAQSLFSHLVNEIVVKHNYGSKDPMLLQKKCYQIHIVP